VITINLLVGRQTPSKGLRSFAAAGCLIATCLVAGGYGLFLQQSRSTLRAKSIEAATRLSETSHLTSRVEGTRRRHEALTRKLAAIREVLDDRTTSRVLLEAVSQSVTDGVWLTEIKRSLLSVQLDGRASSLVEITDLVQQLGANISFARGPDLRSVSAEDADGERVLRFQIVGDLASVAGDSQP
jgi:Tfp pilus assembly protein PilN